jgi:hypothetical protein
MIELMLTMPAAAPVSRTRTRKPRLVPSSKRRIQAWNSSGVAGSCTHGRCSSALACTSEQNSSWSERVSGRSSTRDGVLGMDQR